MTVTDILGSIQDFDIHAWFAGKAFTAEKRAGFYRELAVMLRNRVPLMKALEEMYYVESNEGKKPNEPVAYIARHAQGCVANGVLLGDALSEWIQPGERVLLISGEQSGNLEDTLDSAAVLAETAATIMMAIIGGLLYPAALFVAAVAFLVVFSLKIIPDIMRFVDPTNLGSAGRSMLSVAQFITQYGHFVLLGFIALLAVFFWGMPRYTGRFRPFLDQTVYSVYRMTNGSGFLLSFAALQKAGVPTEKALILIDANGTIWLRDRISAILSGLRAGLHIGEAMKKTEHGFPSKSIVNSMYIFGKYPGFSEALQSMADRWIKESENNVKKSMGFINISAIVFMVCVVGFLAAGFVDFQRIMLSSVRAHR